MGMLFYLPFSICLILGGIILPIRRNYVQGSMGKKVFWLFFSVVLTLAVALLEDQKMGSLYCYSSGANWISLSAGIISFFSGFSIIISDKSLVARRPNPKFVFSIKNQYKMTEIIAKKNPKFKFEPFVSASKKPTRISAV